MFKDTRLPFLLDTKTEDGLITAYAGAPLVPEMFRATGAAAKADDLLQMKKRRNGLSASETLESFFVLWTVGGERCDDLDRLREDKALEKLLEYKLPAAQTARDFLETFHDEKVEPQWKGELCFIHGESIRLQELNKVMKETIAHVQRRSPQTIATLDVDAKVFESTKQSAKWTYEGVKGYQPVVVAWAEQDFILSDEFRDGNVPAGAANAGVVRKALANLPDQVTEKRLRADSALYEKDTLKLCETENVKYAISADMSPSLLAEIQRLPESSWRVEKTEEDAVRQWAEVGFVPDEQEYETKSAIPTRRYLAVRILKKQGSLFADGSDRRHFAVVTNREGDGLEILQWHREKAGTIEHVHDVVANELAAGALPSQKFGANAAWFRMNMILCNLLSAIRHLTLPNDFAKARPKRLRFVLFNTVGRVISHARELILRVASEAVRVLYDASRLKIHLHHA